MKAWTIGGVVLLCSLLGTVGGLYLFYRQPQLGLDPHRQQAIERMQQQADAKTRELQHRQLEYARRLLTEFGHTLTDKERRETEATVERLERELGIRP